MSDAPEIVTAAALTPDSMPSPAAQPAPPVAPALDTAKVDRAGVAFDPARHIDRQNRVTGRWMPRGGRKPGIKSAPPTPPKPPPPSFIPQHVPPPPKDEAAPGESPRAASAPEADHSEDAAECAARAIQFAAGTAFDDHKACTPPPDEHRSMTRAFAAYIRSKGWQATAGVSTVIVVVAWLLRVLQKDKPAAKVKGWLGFDRAEAIDVTSSSATPATPPSAPPKPGGVFEFIPPTEEIQ